MLTNLINNLKINSMTEFNSKIKQNSRILKISLIPQHYSLTLFISA